MFLTQLFYYPISIGQDRFLTLDINLKKFYLTINLLYYLL